MGSEKSPLNSSDSSCARAFLAMTKERMSGQRYTCKRIVGVTYTFECLLDVDSLFGAGLKVWNSAFRLAECHGSLRGNHALVFFYINLISKDNLCVVRQHIAGLLEIDLQKGSSRDLEG